MIYIEPDVFRTVLDRGADPIPLARCRTEVRAST